MSKLRLKQQQTKQQHKYSKKKQHNNKKKKKKVLMKKPVATFDQNTNTVQISNINIYSNTNIQHCLEKQKQPAIKMTLQKA